MFSFLLYLYIYVNVLYAFTFIFIKKVNTKVLYMFSRQFYLHFNINNSVNANNMFYVSRRIVSKATIKANYTSKSDNVLICLSLVLFAMNRAIKFTKHGLRKQRHYVP